MSNFKKQCIGVTVCLLICLLLISPSFNQPSKSPVALAAPTDSYVIGFATSNGGSTSSTNPSGTVTYPSNGPISFSATAGNGYSFSFWDATPSGAASFANPASSSTSATLNGNGTITAHFVQINYSVSATIVPTGGGTVTPNGTAPYHYGDIVILTEVPANGYSFASWSGDGAGTSSTRTVTVTGDMAVVASFTSISYSINVNVLPSSSAGIVTPNPAGPYSYGNSVILTEYPNTGYVFNGWTGDGTGSGTARTVIVTGNMAVVASFAPINYTVTTTVAPSGGGTVIANASSPYHYGDTVILTESPSNGYIFSGWGGDGTGTGATRSVTVTGNMLVAASFTQSAYSVSTTILPLSAGSVTPNSTGPYHFGDVIVLTETPNVGYVFSNWGGSGTGTGTTRTVTVTGNMVVTASFTQNNYSITVSVAPLGAGTITPNATAPYHYGDVVILTETPGDGYSFSGWSGAGTGSNTTRTITINGNMTVTATFALSPTPTPTLSPTSSPALTPSPTPTPSSTPIPTPDASPNPTPNPSPTPIPNSVTINTLTDIGKNATLTFQGDITSSSISGISINTDGSNTTTTISLAVVAQSNTNGFDNVTIPISAVPYGTNPTVYVNNGVAQNQGFTHDSKNYYVWFKTGYSTYELSIAFETQPAHSDFPIWAVIIIIGIVIASILVVMLQKNLKNKRFKLQSLSKITQ